MVSCARATRGLRRPSHGLMARLGVSVGGRVRKLRAVGDRLARPQGRWLKSGGRSTCAVGNPGPPRLARRSGSSGSFGSSGLSGFSSFFG